MATKYDLPNQYVAEYIKYNELYLKGNTRTTTGNISYFSSSSGQTYSISDNTGEQGLFLILQGVLDNYLIKAIDYNLVNTINAKVETLEINSATKTGVEILTNKTITAPKIVNGGSINDENGNEQIKFETTANAVNEITIKNNIAGQSPQVKANGEDTNIDISFLPKGAGRVKDNVGSLARETDVFMKSLFTDVGDLVIASATNTPIRFAKGTALQQLRVKSDGSTLEYFTPPITNNKGTFADTTTTILASGTYTKTIPLGFNPTKGRIMIQGMIAGVYGDRFTYLYFDTNPSNTFGWYFDGNSTANPLKGTNGTTAIIDNTTGGYVTIQSINITADNLVIVFKNNNTGASGQLCINKAVWEVEG
jgi:hypothetical protein